MTFQYTRFPWWALCRITKPQAIVDADEDWVDKDMDGDIFENDGDTGDVASADDDVDDWYCGGDNIDDDND